MAVDFKFVPHPGDVHVIFRANAGDMQKIHITNGAGYSYEIGSPLNTDGWSHQFRIADAALGANRELSVNCTHSPAESSGQTWFPSHSYKRIDSHDKVEFFVEDSGKPDEDYNDTILEFRW